MATAYIPMIHILHEMHFFAAMLSKLALKIAIVAADLALSAQMDG